MDRKIEANQQRNSNTTSQTASSSRIFKLVSMNLANIGCIPIAKYLSTSSQYTDLDLASDGAVLLEEESPVGQSAPVNSHTDTASESNQLSAVTRLNQACQRALGSTDALRYDYIEEQGPDNRQCILTITRPDGLRRSYATNPTFPRRLDAKAEAAAIAISMGAIDFLTIGDSESSKANGGLILTPLDASDKRSVNRSTGLIASQATKGDASVKTIEACCAEWRAGRVTPTWISLVESKLGSRQGCTLRIELSPHSLRVYSTDTNYSSFEEAKNACANIAVSEGVLEYIKFGNGQTRPASPMSFAEMKANNPTNNPQNFRPPMTLQSFYESLPRPFPENVGDKKAVEINAPTWLNAMMHTVRGARMTINFIFTSDSTPGLHGCLLRLEGPDETKSYLVDAMFSKRADAKAAVCLQAMSQRVGDYIRAISAFLENKISQVMRKRANEQVFPVLVSELHKIRPGASPRFEFDREKDAYGCKLTLELSSEPGHEDVQTYVVPAEYRTKAEARVAVTCLAADQGAIEFLRSRGNANSPSGEIATSIANNANSSLLGKRKERQGDRFADRGQRIKREEGELSSSEGHNEDLAARWMGNGAQSRGRTQKKPFNRNQWKRPGISGSGGVASMSNPGQIGQQTLHYHNGLGNASAPAMVYPESQVPFGYAVNYGPPPITASVGDSVGNTPASYAPSVGFAGASAPPPFPQFNLAPGFSPEGYGQNTFPSVPPANSYPTGYENQNGYGYPPVLFNGAPAPTYMPQPPAPPPPPPPQLYGPPAFAPQYHLLPFSNAPPASSYSEAPQSYPPPFAMGTMPVSGQFQMQQISGGPVPGPPVGPSPFLSYPQNTPYVPPPSQPNTPAIKVEDTPDLSNLAPQQRPKNHRPEHRKLFNRGMGTEGHRGHKYDRQGKSQTTSGAVRNQGRHDKKHAINNTTAKLPSQVKALSDFCREEGMPKPIYHHETLKDDEGQEVYKVWVIVGTQRLELPRTYSTLPDGRERIAKQVLSRLRSQDRNLVAVQ